MVLSRSYFKSDFNRDMYINKLTLARESDTTNQHCEGDNIHC